MTLTLSVPVSAKLTDQQFYEICQANQDLRIERTAIGELLIMLPTGGNTSKRNSSLNAQLWLWNEQTKLGEVFDSSGGFRLPNGADRSPDAAWVISESWSQLTSEQQEKFPPICPDFVLELRSPTDSLKPLQEKMQEYLDNGARLGWLLNHQERQVEIYRSNQAKEILESPATLSGENVLPGFILRLNAFW